MSSLVRAGSLSDFELLESRSQKSGAVSIKPTKRGRLQIFRLPEKGVAYAIGVDTSEGRVRDTGNDLSALSTAVTPDFSVACVIDLDANMTVATYATLEPVTEFSIKIMWLYNMYHDPFTVIEANGPGLAVLLKLEELGCRNMYTREVLDKTDKTWVNRKGFKTTQTTRAALIAHTQESIVDEDGIGVLDREIWDELRSFVYNQHGREEAAAGCKDDRVFALMLALWGRRSSWKPPELREGKKVVHPDEWVWKDLRRKARKRSADELD